MLVVRIAGAFTAEYSIEEKKMMRGERWSIKQMESNKKSLEAKL